MKWILIHTYPHSVQSRVYETAGRPSVCLSRHSAAAPRCGGFAAVGPAGGRYRSIAAARPARRSNCEQCRVVSGRRQLNADLFWYGWSWLALFCCTTREWRHSWCQRSVSNFNSCSVNEINLTRGRSNYFSMKSSNNQHTSRRNVRPWPTKETLLSCDFRNWSRWESTRDSVRQTSRSQV